MLNYKMNFGFSALLNTKYVGTQNLDNTGQRSRVLAAYIVNDLGLRWTKRINGADALLQLMVTIYLMKNTLLMGIRSALWSKN